MIAFSTRIHAYAHYTFAGVLLLAPWGAGFAGLNAETVVAVVIGIVIIVYGMFTDNELGLVKQLQMPLHLWIDALAGILLATAPWVFSFDERVWVPHLAVGLLLLILAAASHTIPGYERRGSGRTAAD